MKCSRWEPFPADVPVYQWDWHILLSDGSVWRFHTDWSKKTASVVEVKSGDELPLVPVNGINKSDGPGSYKGYKVGNYQSTPKLMVADAESAVAETESAVAETGTTAASSNAVGSPTVAPTEMDSPTESLPSTASLEVETYRGLPVTDVDIGGGRTITTCSRPPWMEASEFLHRTRPKECPNRVPTEAEWLNASRGDPTGGSGSAVRRGNHSAPRSGWSRSSRSEDVPTRVSKYADGSGWKAPTWSVQEWNSYTHGGGATSTVQPNDTDVHKDEESAVAEEQAAQHSGDDTPAKKAVRFNGTDSVHYMAGRSSDQQKPWL